MSTEKPWWYPQLADADWIARLRADYPDDTANMDDEAVRDKYSDGWKYVDTWDHLGDARAQFEGLADAYVALLSVRWLPISTAPEESVVLVSAKGETPVAAHLFVGAWTLYVPGTPMLFQPALAFKPTHWMPQPTPPEREEVP